MGKPRLDQPGSDLYREDFERQHPDQVRELRLAEERRRGRKAEEAGEDEGPVAGELDYEGEEEESQARTRSLCEYPDRASPRDLVHPARRKKSWFAGGK
jgi:hypothetical protein